MPQYSPSCPGLQYSGIQVFFPSPRQRETRRPSGHAYPSAALRGDACVPPPYHGFLGDWEAEMTVEATYDTPVHQRVQSGCPERIEADSGSRLQKGPLVDLLQCLAVASGELTLRLAPTIWHAGSPSVPKFFARNGAGQLGHSLPDPSETLRRPAMLFWPALNDDGIRSRLKRSLPRRQPQKLCPLPVMASA